MLFRAELYLLVFTRKNILSRSLVYRKREISLFLLLGVAQNVIPHNKSRVKQLFERGHNIVTEILLKKIKFDASPFANVIAYEKRRFIKFIFFYFLRSRNRAPYFDKS